MNDKWQPKAVMFGSGAGPDPWAVVEFFPALREGAKTRALWKAFDGLCVRDGWCEGDDAFIEAQRMAEDFMFPDVAPVGGV